MDGIWQLIENVYENMRDIPWRLIEKLRENSGGGVVKLRDVGSKHSSHYYIWDLRLVKLEEI